MDFVEVIKKIDSRGNMTIEPKFIVGKVQDLMTRGRDFYAVWDEQANVWSKDQFRLVSMVDDEIRKVVNEMPPGATFKVRTMQDYSSGVWSDFIKYIKELPQNYVELDDVVTFLDQPTSRENYISKRLPYNLDPNGDISAYEELISNLYDEENRRKIEWAIGCILNGDSIYIQKFMVFYGESGTGKSTIMNIILKIFEGYSSLIDAKAITSGSNPFAMEQMLANPLVAMEHDTDLSRIEDNTKLNSLVSHEWMTVNAKFKAPYQMRPRSFIFLGTNKPVKITDSKSGIIRRLIDVNPTGKIIEHTRYNKLVTEVPFEIGAIASHCLDVYKQLGMFYYDTYRPTSMIYETNVFYNFVNDEVVYKSFIEADSTTLRDAYQMYKRFCEEYAVEYKMPMYRFREELKSYFDEFHDRWNGMRSFYRGFKLGRPEEEPEESELEHAYSWLDMDESTISQFDILYSNCKAQYANKYEVPRVKWDECDTLLKDISTSTIHYVQPPDNHVVIDFDLTGPDGEKNLELNLEAAKDWPETYAEVSKSGNGLHLHYEYSGDVTKLSKLYSKGIEIKTFTGHGSLRRCLTKCNNSPIKIIGSGLPLKGEKMVDHTSIENEKMLRAFIKNCLKKKHHGATKPEVNYIYDELEKMYTSGQHYDVTDMRPQILAFANNSTHNSEFCVELVSKMKWHSEENGNNSVTIVDENGEEVPIAFYDVEVFKNLFIICYKLPGEENQCVEMINPTPEEVNKFISCYRLIGFNNRRYDNHIVYARAIGYTLMELYQVSQRIVNGSSNAFFREAYNISYTDVYDFASNPHKMSLKKWEIKLGIHHQELGLPWDEEVPEELWKKVADYCCNDVVATEKTFDHIQGDWAARKILAAISGLTYNDTTNSHSIKIIFGDNKHPQDEFNYVDLSEMFPGYEFKNGKSTYRGIEVGEGGFVYAEPGMHGNVALLDVASMHPSSIEALELFGPYYTERFISLKNGRLYIKHEEYDKLGDILDGKMKPFAESLRDGTADFTGKDLSTALKTVINSVYGLTFAHFDNPCRDPRNKDNIVAKRGALFMVDLMFAVQEKGYTVAHIKTDSIKIPNADEEIISFVMEFGKKYGYTFEHESTYNKMCLVNNAVYIAREVAEDGTLGEWNATGAQFAEPYVYKTLFSHEDISISDLGQTKLSSKGDIYIDMNEGLGEDQHNYIFIGKAGSFLPIMPGHGGGELFTLREEKYNALAGTKGWRWLETEMVLDLKKEDDIDMAYYQALVDDAIENISKFGDFEWLVSDEIYESPPWLKGAGESPVKDFMNPPVDENGEPLPFG